MATLKEVPEEAHKNLEEHRRVVEESKKATGAKELQ
jgi:preprotein translocase subunit Sss1